jgi:hypothetical protein
MRIVGADSDELTSLLENFEQQSNVLKETEHWDSVPNDEVFVSYCLAINLQTTVSHMLIVDLL